MNPSYWMLLTNLAKYGAPPIVSVETCRGAQCPCIRRLPLPSEAFDHLSRRRVDDDMFDSMD